MIKRSRRDCIRAIFEVAWADEWSLRGHGSFFIYFGERLSFGKARVGGCQRHNVFTSAPFSHHT